MDGLPETLPLSKQKSSCILGASGLDPAIRALDICQRRPKGLFMKYFPHVEEIPRFRVHMHFEPQICRQSTVKSPTMALLVEMRACDVPLGGCSAPLSITNVCQIPSSNCCNTLAVFGRRPDVFHAFGSPHYMELGASYTPA